MILGTPVGLEVRPRGGVALPGLSSSCRDEQAQRWSPRYQEQMHKWQDRSSPCERPRTYDRFYQKLPGNFQEPQTDSAISVCSSEENEKVVNSDKKSCCRSLKSFFNHINIFMNNIHIYMI